MSEPILVQIDNQEHPATSEEQAQIDAIRAGSPSPLT